MINFLWRRHWLSGSLNQWHQEKWCTNCIQTLLIGEMYSVSRQARKYKKKLFTTCAELVAPRQGCTALVRCWSTGGMLWGMQDNTNTKQLAMQLAQIKNNQKKDINPGHYVPKWGQFGNFYDAFIG